MSSDIAAAETVGASDAIVTTDDDPGESRTTPKVSTVDERKKVLLYLKTLDLESLKAKDRKASLPSEALKKFPDIFPPPSTGMDHGKCRTAQMQKVRRWIQEADVILESQRGSAPGASGGRSSGPNKVAKGRRGRVANSWVRALRNDSMAEAERLSKMGVNVTPAILKKVVLDVLRAGKQGVYGSDMVAGGNKAKGESDSTMAAKITNTWVAAMAENSSIRLQVGNADVGKIASQVLDKAVSGLVRAKESSAVERILRALLSSAMDAGSLDSLVREKQAQTPLSNPGRSNEGVAAAGAAAVGDATEAIVDEGLVDPLAMGAAIEESRVESANGVAPTSGGNSVRHARAKKTWASILETGDLPPESNT